MKARRTICRRRKQCDDLEFGCEDGYWEDGATFLSAMEADPTQQVAGVKADRDLGIPLSEATRLVWPSKIPLID